MPSPRTVARRIFQTYWLEAWMGPELDQRLYCPGAVLGVDFDPDDPDDTAPYTPEEVRTEVGFVRLRIDEIDRWQGPMSAGLVDVGGGVLRFVSYRYRLENLQFAIRAPAGADLELAEGFADAIEALFDGVSFSNADPWLSIRNLGQYPTTRRGPVDDDPWQVLFLDVKLRCRERRTHQGLVEVTT